MIPTHLHRYALPLLMTTLLGTALAPAALANPFEKTLDNGMRVIVKEDRRAPTVVHMVWYRTGAMDEQDGSSGLAHMLEHMMFKGTQKVGPGEFSKRVAAVGGRDNAFTSRDYTAYFQQVPKRALPEMMALEADRMANLKLDPKEFAPELKVVMEERRMRTEDNPQALVYERLNATAFQVHPYRRPVIGWMDDLSHMTWQDAENWYKRWYTPGNATLVVVGDVDHRALFKLAEQHYGRLKSRALPERRTLAEPQQLGIKRINVKAPAKLPYLMMAWKTPKLVDVNRDRDPYALEMLAAVLDGHEASRLSKNLVRGSRVAQSAGAGYDATLRGESMFMLDGQPAEGRSVAELEAALRAEIRAIQEQGVTEEELARVKNQAIAGQIYKRDSMMGQAMEIGMLEVIGMRWQDIDRMIERLRTVSTAEVQTVARKYFVDDTLTVATLDPQPISEEAAARAERTAASAHLH
ncbi:putative Zn-dependent peptidase [Sterolibacterium denitrificans]|uniref:Peptidase M16 n=2 Tax=Sterolibacterium denitrificans TaxID=157592 RepID=A0A656ZCX5_9PROT|nr:peptidase M16 [Sterolibacterium denitrificans]SMB21362.1 putative Zn-dependent peptidase [Sterolibacterium denitrificans]